MLRRGRTVERGRHVRDPPVASVASVQDTINQTNICVDPKQHFSDALVLPPNGPREGNNIGRGLSLGCQNYPDTR